MIREAVGVFTPAGAGIGVAMKAYNGEIAARACFVRIGRDPDKDPELLAEIQRAIENGVNEARKFGTPAAVHDAQQTAIAAAEEANAPVADAIYNEQVEPRLKDVIILVEKIDALAQLRAKEAE